MLLREVIQGINQIRTIGDLNIKVDELTHDSREICRNSLFIAIEGNNVNGHDFIEEAIGNGAVAVVVERPVEVAKEISQIIVADTKKILYLLANNFYQSPSKDILLIGVTGTNGKTTTTYLIKSMLDAREKKVGLIGTICNLIGNKELPTQNTTPLALDLQRTFSKMKLLGTKSCVMEVSSHALELGRVEGSFFDIGIFTNLSEDHLDFHGTLENYLNAKLKLFSKTSLANIVNIDDKYGEIVYNHVMKMATPYITYGIEKEADVMAKDLELHESSSTFLLKTKDFKERVTLSIPGLFNIYNALAAIAAALVIGIDNEDIKRVLSTTRGARGRFETITTKKGFTIIVDYAHTPEGLRNILQSVKEFASKRVIVVFGCGGNRDKTKRPIMGDIGTKLADIAIITSDNPRKENPRSIITDIIAGIPGTRNNYLVVENRKQAIEKSIRIANEGDVIVLAGKGHETYQILDNVTIPFDEIEIIRNILEEEEIGWKK